MFLEGLGLESTWGFLIKILKKYKTKAMYGKCRLLLYQNKYEAL